MTITSLGTQLNSHQQLCMCNYGHNYVALNGERDHYEWGNSPLVLPVQGL